MNLLNKRLKIAEALKNNGDPNAKIDESSLTNLGVNNSFMSKQEKSKVRKQTTLADKERDLNSTIDQMLNQDQSQGAESGIGSQIKNLSVASNFHTEDPDSNHSIQAKN